MQKVMNYRTTSGLDLILDCLLTPGLHQAEVQNNPIGQNLSFGKQKGRGIGVLTTWAAPWLSVSAGVKLMALTG